jgi:chromatin structure-remodeling complex subunit RSC9
MGFPVLAEALMVKAMEITLLCTGVGWEFERDLRNPMDRVTTLNALQGTPDILDRIEKLPITLPDDTLETGEFRDRLRNIKEATLVLRNMCTLEENARYITSSAKGLLRDFLVVLLNVPNQPRFNEIKNDALDIAEEVTRFMPTSQEDPLRISLFRCLESEDRAHIVRALRALTHFSTEMEPVPARNYVVEGVPEACLRQLFYNTLLVQDKDILSGTMDFWYQFTLVPANVEAILRMANLPLEFMHRMVSLLSYESRVYIHEDVIQEEKIAPPPSEIPKVPTELLDALMKLSEPERSSRWLRCCFVEDADCEITQIALWQAYQSRFADPRMPGGGVLPAAEFIKNVSTTFTNAQAQVITGPDNATRFIIKGIRPLDTAHTFDGWPYLYCKWADDTQSSKRCGRAFTTPTELRSHVFEDHMGLKPSEQPGHYNLEKADAPIHTCKWNNCTKFKSSGPSDDTVMVVEHVASHLPQDRDPNAQPPSTKRAVLQERIVRTMEYCDTPVDKNGDPVGVAYKAALVLRNIVKNLPPGNSDERFRHVPWKDALFTNHRASIVDHWTRNRALRLILTDVLMAINKDWA